MAASSDVNGDPARARIRVLVDFTGFCKGFCLAALSCSAANPQEVYLVSILEPGAQILTILASLQLVDSGVPERRASDVRMQRCGKMPLNSPASQLYADKDGPAGCLLIASFRNIQLGESQGPHGS